MANNLAVPGVNHLSKENHKQWKKLLRAESRTDGADLERRRLLLAEKSKILDFISQACMNDDPKKQVPPDELHRMTAAATLLGMQGMIEGIGLLVDCVTNREQVILDNGKPGWHRFSIASHAAELNEALWGVPPDPESQDPEEQAGEAGLVDLIETGLSMLEEIGEKEQAFKDDKGVYRPGKYSDRKPDIKPEKTACAVPDAVTQDEIDQTTNMTEKEAFERLKKGKK